MKQLTQTPPTWQKKATPLLGLLFIFSGWGYSTQAIAASVDAAIPQESLFGVISARAKKLAEQEYAPPKNIELEALNNIDDYKLLAKTNPSTICKILSEPLILNLKNKELGTHKIIDRLNSQGIQKSTLGCD